MRVFVVFLGTFIKPFSIKATHIIGKYPPIRYPPVIGGQEIGRRAFGSTMATAHWPKPVWFFH
jgi:hypothetical protein